MNLHEINELVRWAQLETEFARLFPVSVSFVENTGKAARVYYAGIPFEIRPFPSEIFRSHSALPFQVWGAPFLNNFPNPYSTPTQEVSR